MLVILNIKGLTIFPYILPSILFAIYFTYRFSELSVKGSGDKQKNKFDLSKNDLNGSIDASIILPTSGINIVKLPSPAPKFSLDG